MTLFALLLLSFLAAPVAFVAARYGAAATTALIPALLFTGFLTYGPEVMQLGAVVQHVQWIPSLGISLSFRLDGLALTFILLITGIGTAIFLYASAYLSRSWRTPRFFATLTVFMASMLGAVLSDNLPGLLVFWELTSLSSFMLIGYDPAKPASRRSAQQGLLITVAGGLAMLAGIILLGTLSGTYEISGLLTPETRAALAGPSGAMILVLIAIGAFSKSAQFPLHSWLANAMVAPTPVSAYLHSATMVKQGVYLLARLNPVLSENALWTPLLVSIGCLTMLCGAILALRETDPVLHAQNLERSLLEGCTDPAAPGQNHPIMRTPVRCDHRPVGTDTMHWPEPRAVCRLFGRSRRATDRSRTLHQRRTGEPLCAQLITYSTGAA